MSEKKTATNHYENNPFFVAANGIMLLFDLARGVGIMFLIFSLFSFFRSGPRWDTAEPDNFTRFASSWTFLEWSIAVTGVLVFAVAVALLMAFFGGVSSYTSAQIANGKRVKLGKAFRESARHVLAFLWLNILITVKVFLWSLLFIIPGIYMTFRYSLSGVAFFDKGLRGDAAIKKSVQLTRNGWVTTFASNMLFNLLTLGALGAPTTIGVNSVLYRQFTKAGKNKPEAHWLSWMTLAGMLLFLLFAAVLVVAVTLGYVAGTLDR